MKLKKIATKSIVTLMAASMALTPLAAFAKPANEPFNVTYNESVTKKDGSLKKGYTETKDPTKTWWKTEYYYTDWTETNEAGYNAVKNADLKKIDESERTNWRKADKAEYDAVSKVRPDDARKNGYTDWKAADKAAYDAAADDLRKREYTDYSECDKATYDKAADDLKKREYSEWKTADKAAYDAAADDLRKVTYGDYKVVDKATYDKASEDCRKSSKSDWRQFADETNWEQKYNEWLNYAEDSRRMSGSGDFREVSADEYIAFAEKYPGREGDLYKYEDTTYASHKFTGWIFVDEQIIANTYNANGGHDPFFILVDQFNPNGYTGCEGGTWDGNNDGIRYFDANNGVCAQNVGETLLNEIKKNNVPYKTISSGSEIAKLGADKYNAHNSDGVHNAGRDGGNGFIDIVDDDFTIYYYGGTGTIECQELYGILIAPYATVNVGGKWIGTIVADTVCTASNWHESSKWCYPIDKGDVERKYFVRGAKLEVMDDVYEVREAKYEVRDYKYFVRDYKYFVRDNVYEVRDVVKRYFVRSIEEKKFYCVANPYVPQTGDLGTIFLFVGLAAIIAIGGGFVIVSFKKDKNSKAE